MDANGKSYNNLRTRQLLMKMKQIKKHVLMQQIHKHESQQHNCMAVATNIMFTQMSAHKGIKMFGKPAVVALVK